MSSSLVLRQKKRESLAERNMVIIDTTIWIEFFRKKAEYVEKVKTLLNHRLALGISVIGAEILQGAKNQREVEQIQGIFENLPELDHPIDWLDAGLFSNQHNLINSGIGIIDAFIIKSALVNDSKIWTLDKKIIQFTPQENLYQFEIPN